MNCLFFYLGAYTNGGNHKDAQVTHRHNENEGPRKRRRMNIPIPVHRSPFRSGNSTVFNLHARRMCRVPHRNVGMETTLLLVRNFRVAR